jgi:uncharacterized membrane protein YbhN (UPF0104 family)
VKRAAVRLFYSRITRVILGLAVGFLCLYLALRGVDWLEVHKVIAGADLLYVALAFGVTLVNIALKILRWRVQLAPAGRTSGSRIAASFLSAQMLNAVVPIRLGEVQRIYILGKSGIAILLLWLPLPEWMGGSVTALIVITLIQALLLFILALKRDYLLGLVEKFSRHFSMRIKELMMKNVHSGFASLDVLRQPTQVLKLSLITASIWSAALLTNYWILLALDIQAPLAASLLVLIAVQAGISLPSLPGKIGVFELACLLALEVFGFSQAIGLSYGILLHAVIFIPILLSGLASFLFLQIKSPPLA